MDRQKLKDELTRDEGRRLTAYKDSEGYWTIGIGHLLGSSPRMSSITNEECDALYDYDVNLALLRAGLYIPVFNGLVAEVRVRALVNMTFNLGTRITEFKKFLAALEAEDYPTAAKEMLDSLWARQVGDRAKRLAHMIETGTDV